MKISEQINAGNWMKYGLRDDNGRGCLLYYVSDGDQLLALEDTIEKLYPERMRTRGMVGIVASFNDHPDTTLEDVLRVCKFADV